MALTIKKWGKLNLPHSFILNNYRTISKFHSIFFFDYPYSLKNVLHPQITIVCWFSLIFLEPKTFLYSVSSLFDSLLCLSIRVLVYEFALFGAWVNFLDKRL